jgi:hypothetical protein
VRAGTRRGPFRNLERGRGDPRARFRDPGAWSRRSAGEVSGSRSVVARICGRGFGISECGREGLRARFRDPGVWSRGSAGAGSGSRSVGARICGRGFGLPECGREDLRARVREPGVWSRRSVGAGSGPRGVVAKICGRGFGTPGCGREDLRARVRDPGVWSRRSAGEKSGLRSVLTAISRRDFGTLECWTDVLGRETCARDGAQPRRGLGESVPNRGIPSSHQKISDRETTPARHRKKIDRGPCTPPKIAHCRQRTRWSRHGGIRERACRSGWHAGLLAGNRRGAPPALASVSFVDDTLQHRESSWWARSCISQRRR